MSPRRYDEEFKRNCVDLLVTGGRTLKPLARELGVSAATLREWRDRHLGKLEAEDERPPGGRRRGKWPMRSGVSTRSWLGSCASGKS